MIHIPNSETDLELKNCTYNQCIGKCVIVCLPIQAASILADDTDPTLKKEVFKEKRQTVSSRHILVFFNRKLCFRETFYPH